MKFFKKRGVALAVLVLSIAAAVCIGQSRKAGYIAKQPVTLPEVKYHQWICDEAGLPLTVENVRPQPKHHPRCGTSFLFVVIIVSILVSSIVFPYIDWQNIWVRIGVKLLLLIPVVGVTYEFNRFVGAHDNVVTRILSAPGMWMQNFTTNEPDDSMIEVAIEAMKLVIPAEEGKDQW